MTHTTDNPSLSGGSASHNTAALPDAATLADDLALAHELADAVDALTMERFGAADLYVETKPDATPVTEADRQAEQLIRERLSQARPGDAVFGEEFGSTGDSNRVWIIDPIDGTKNFMRGVPVWATLIALVEDGEVVVGLVSAPALGRRWWASVGGGAFTGASLDEARRIGVSGVTKLEDSSFSYSSLTGWKARGWLDGVLAISDTVWRTRAYGDFFSYCLVAEGAVDFAAEPELNLYDMAALVPIVREAGGVFTSLQGEDGPWGGNAIASNGLLHDAALNVLGTRGAERTPTPLPNHQHSAE
ncbi:histidinol-phosphatase [Pseudoglutamicibacter albus]|uniref:histidinol-phosphatase n=1 Tax=Pseudoglutamicibacter albus TaxID=98671 RepID=UPI000A06945A|nr:histidinol-phosphatase [Pseudoglutamicibacter albus]